MVADQNLLNGQGRSPNAAIDGEPAEGAKPKGMNFAPLLRTVFRNIPLIVSSAIVISVIAATTVNKVPKIYQGSFRILVEPITSQGRASDPSAISRAQSQETANNIDYPTLLQVLQSPEILDKVSKQIQSRYPDVTADSLNGELFAKNLVVQRLGKDLSDSTRLIEVTYKGKDKERVRFVLEELSKGYLRYSLEDRRARIGGGVEFIEDQLPSLQQRVNSLELQLQTLKQQYRLTDPVSEGSALSKQLLDARAQRLQTQRELDEQKALLDRLQAQIGLNPDQALAAASLSENPRYQELIAQIKKLDAEIAVKAARLQPKSPPLISLQNQRQNLVGLLERETQLNLNGSQVEASREDSPIRAFQNATRLGLIKQLVETSNMAQSLQIRNDAVSRNEADLDRQLGAFPETVRKYNDLQQKLEIATKTLNQFLTQRETLRIEAAQKEVPWEVLAAPALAKDVLGNEVPADNGASKRPLMGLAAGAVLGLLAAFLKDKLRNIFFSSDDVPDLLQLPLLGVVPLRKGVPPLIDPAMAGEDGFAKAFGTLYTNLRFLPNQGSIRSLIVGSAIAGEGKTTVATNLALSAASMGQRVLLVDANLRNPGVHDRLGLPNSYGLSNVLSDASGNWESGVQRSSLEKNLSVLTAGPVSLESSRLLAAKEMQTLMQHFQSAFDLVIYDTANLTQFADSTFLAAQTAGVLMVVSVRKVKQPAVKHVLAELKKFRLPVLGVVPNFPGKGGTTAAGDARPYAQFYSSQSAPMDGMVLPASSTSAQRASDSQI